MKNNSTVEISGSLISYFSNKVKLHGGLNLAQGIPGFTPPVKLLDILSEIRFENYHQYAPGTGNNNLLKAIENMYPEKEESTRIFITSGATEAISLIYTYLERKLKGKLKVLSFSPAYESYIHLPKIFGNEFFSYPVNDENLFDKSEFEKFFVNNNIKLLFVASPGNPYGKTLSKEHIEFLKDLVERNNAYLIIDAVYSSLYFNGEKPYHPTGAITPNVFYINSFSKRFSVTGWRVGYMFMHEKHFKEISYIHDYIGLSSAAPFQQALALFLNTPEAKKYEEYLREQTTENLISASEKLNINNFRCPKIDGGYFIWAELPEHINDSLQFGIELYDNARTAIIPGVHFGDEWNNYIRINIARDSAELNAGIDSIIEFSKKARI
ncbi:MAG: pyridoxal phosphate-dependent aminotransferase [Bacteroidales bacterium]|jgi:aspartate/methionine/tyrosine aminotransferase|nr:pyridoxal phosphate-dependent aminotransferase [Bacteroidales bacterium]